MRPHLDPLDQQLHDPRPLGRSTRLGVVMQTKRGKLVDKGYLDKLLNNRTYLGMAVHKGMAHPGEHAAIIDQPLWDTVQAIVSENAVTRSGRTRAQKPALLKGLLFGPTGAAMSPTHTRKGNGSTATMSARTC